jgi:wyosine [tRNA(Phe)-imidazoG37] synthetase (radical SAM superfamily)
LRTSRSAYYRPQKIINQVETQIRGAKLQAERIDYVTFVSDGEPTLDKNIGIEIELLKSFGIKIAVLTNASLLWDKNVRNELHSADLVSLKVDTVVEDGWREINRPHGSLCLSKILSGMTEFSKNYKGQLITESMYTDRSATRIDDVKKTADFIAAINPSRAYVSIPTRPPAERMVGSPSESELFNVFIQYFERDIRVEYLIDYEGNAFAFTGDAVHDLLSITSVHPMREDAVNEYLHKAHETWDLVDNLLQKGQLKETYHKSNKFLIRDMGIVDV